MILLTEHGPKAMASPSATLMSVAMEAELEQAIHPELHQGIAERKGYTNGFKAKKSRPPVGEVSQIMPQTCGYHHEAGRTFYPKILERGQRSERAFMLAVAELSVQGGSTRMVTAVVEEHCSLEITSTHVSRAAAELGEPFAALRNRRLGEVRFQFLDARHEKVRPSGTVRSCAVLSAIGVTPDGKGILLG